MKVALVCIAKNEDLYIKEWIDYHLKLGFDDIIIYQNDWRWDYEQNNVVKHELDGQVKQREAYNHFIQKNFRNYDWVAFFDVDEFLVLKKHENIKKFIEDYSQYPSISINWVLFGDNNIETTTDDFSVLKRFTKRQKGINPHIKCIVKMNRNIKMDVHNPNVNWIDSNFRIGRGPYNKYGDDRVVQLNHYFCKTENEFKSKCNRGRADIIGHERNMEDFHRHNFNEIEDLKAINFYNK